MTVKKLNFFTEWMLQSNEAFLTDMAKQGLHFKRFKSCYTEFTKGRPEEAVYRIIYLKRHLTKAELEEKKALGWTYVFHINNSYVFKGTAKSPSLHINLKEEVEAIIAYRRSTKWTAVLYCGVFALVFLADLISLLTSHYFMLELIETPNLFSLPILYGYMSVQAVWSLKALKLAKERLEGKVVKKESWKRQFKKANFYLATLVGLLVLLTAGLIYSFKQDQEVSFTANEATAPLIALQEIEQNPNLALAAEEKNHIRYEWNILTPIQYEARQEGIIEEEEVETPNIRETYYRLRFSRMAVPVARQLAQRHEAWNEETTLEITNPGFDYLAIYQSSQEQVIYAALGNQVLEVHYEGNQAVEKVLGVMKQKLGA